MSDKDARAALITARKIVGKSADYGKAIDFIHDRIKKSEYETDSILKKYTTSNNGIKTVNYNSADIDPDYIDSNKKKSILYQKETNIERSKGRINANNLSIIHSTPGSDAFISGNHPSVPPIVYHGSVRNIKQFPYMAHFGTNRAAHDRLSYDSVSGENSAIYPARLSVKNPLDLGYESGWENNYDTLSQISDKLRGLGKTEHANALSEIASHGERGDKTFREMSAHMKKAADIIKSAGYDGISYTNDSEDPGSTSFIALHPEQVKSAIGNSGAFDPKSKTITKATGGSVGNSKIKNIEEAQKNYDMYDKALTDTYNEVSKKGIWGKGLMDNLEFAKAIKDHDKASKILDSFKPSEKIVDESDVILNKLHSTYASKGSDSFISGNHPSVPPVLFHASGRDLKSFRHFSHFGTIGAANDRFHNTEKVFEEERNEGYKVHANQKIYPVRLKMKSPLDIGEEDGWDTDYDAIHQIANTFRDMNMPNHEKALKELKWEYMLPDKLIAKDMKKASDIIKSAGYDGVSYINAVEDPGSRSFIALHPEQVKSAIGNSGAFDPKSKIITKATGGPVGKPDYQKAIDHVWYESKKTTPKLMEIEKKYEYEKVKNGIPETYVKQKKLEKDPDYIAALAEYSRLDNKMNSIKRARDSIHGKNINQVYMNKGASYFISGNHRSVPPVVFHGSRSDLHDFRHMSHFGTVTAAKERLFKIKPISVFGHDEKETIYPVRLSMKNPLDVGQEENWNDNYDPLLQISNKLREVGKIEQANSLNEIYGWHPHYANNLEKFSNQHRKINPDEHLHMAKAADIIRDAGYDGISYKNMVEDPGSRSFIALHPEQVKSAIGNSGAFDPKSKIITKATGGPVGKPDYKKATDFINAKITKAYAEDLEEQALEEYADETDLKDYDLYNTPSYLKISALYSKLTNIEKAENRSFDKKLNSTSSSPGSDAFIAGNHRSVPPLVYHGSKRNIKSFPHMAHFGTNKAANDRLSGFVPVEEDGAIYPVRLSMKKPLDLGKEDNWEDNFGTISKISDKLRSLGHSDHANALSEIASHGVRVDIPFREVSAHMKKAADIIKDAGYDGISYINSMDDPGSRSFIALHPEQVKSAIGNSGAFDPKSKTITKATGGSVEGQPEGFEPIGDQPYKRRLNRMGLYSKAAEIAHNLTQKKGSLDQFMAAVKSKGAKPSEIEHAGTPQVNSKTTNTQVGHHFDRGSPDLSVVKLGGRARQLTRDESDRLYVLSNRHNAGGGPLNPYERIEMRRLSDIANGRGGNFKSTKFHEYKTEGGDNYREHLITIPSKGDPALSWHDEDSPSKADFYHTHWEEPNVLAHVRMQDMKVKGVTRSEEDRNKLEQLDNHALKIYSQLADMEMDDSEINHLPSFRGASEAFNSELKRQINNKRDQKTLHIDEIQSDWGQQGREHGFKGDKKPVKEDFVPLSEIEINSIKSNMDRREKELKAAGRHEGDQIYDEELYKLGQMLKEEASPHTGIHDIPKGPYVQNTQHWTDLALKHVLHEAAHGDYDKVQFATGKENSDRYGQQFKSLTFNQDDNVLKLENRWGDNHLTSIYGGKPLHKRYLEKIIGHELTKRLLASPETEEEGKKVKKLVGDVLLMGGEGMKKFYDQMIPKSAMNLIQQHDPDIKPDKITGKDGIERFGFSMTPKARESIKRGQTMFASGGAVISEAQKHAGNYKREHLNIQGLNIAIENTKGSTRSGKDKSGKPWSVKMPADYGYIKGTSGADGDHVDTYVGPDVNSDSVFVVDQKDHVSGKFDEHKVLIGFKSLHDATEVYKAAFNDGKGSARMGNVTRLTMHEFKNWLKNQNTTKPISKQSLIDKALSISQSVQRSA